MGSIYNTDMAIGFAFSRIETKDSFNLLITVIHKKYEINFEEKIIETDQGLLFEVSCYTSIYFSNYLLIAYFIG